MVPADTSGAGSEACQHGWEGATRDVAAHDGGEIRNVSASVQIRDRTWMSENLSSCFTSRALLACTRSPLARADSRTHSLHC